MNRLFIFSFFIGYLLFFSCKDITVNVKNEGIYCDAEKTDSTGIYLKSNIEGFNFKGGRNRTTEVAYSGNYSLKTEEKDHFIFSVTLDSCIPEEYFEMSVWKYGDPGKVVIVAYGKDTKNFYKKSSYPRIKGKKGWEKIDFRFFLPPDFIGKQLHVYVWKIDSALMYFDDFRIKKSFHKKYPEYNKEALEIIVNSEGMESLSEKRIEAFKLGVLESNDDDYVKAKLAYAGDTLKSKVRLKGDWLDHLEGDKWSFRIKMRKDDSFLGLRTFSVQTPASRSFLHEWIAHKLFEKEDILTTRYEFIPVKLNGKSLGIYALEEHFDKQLIESRNRREGPIVKFSEDAFWKTQKLYKQTGKLYNLPFLKTSLIEAFKEDRTLSDKYLRNDFIIAQNLMYQYKNDLKPINEIFDIELMAKFLAIIDLTHSVHGYIWHNLRFYYNPMTARLEPVAFDCYANSPVPMDKEFFVESAISADTLNTSDYLLLKVFKDEVFVKFYLKYLEKFTSPEYLESFIKEVSTEVERYTGMIVREFPEYIFNTKYLYDQAGYLRNKLPEIKNQLNDNTLSFKVKKADNLYILHDETLPFMVQFFLNKDIVQANNFLPGSVNVLGLYHGDSLLNCIDKLDIPEKDHELQYFTFKIPGDIEVDRAYLEYKGHKFYINIHHWPAPDGKIKIQEFVKNGLKNYMNKEEIVFDKGQYNISTSIIIPKGKKVILKSGARINLVNHAAFISYSPVKAEGKSDNPVLIFSKDGTGNGFTVIKTNQPSYLNYTTFDQLNTLNKYGWTYTGAVSFYEADVKMQNVIFSNNRSEDALNIVKSKFDMENCKFDNIFADAFDSDFSSGEIKISDFGDIGNDAIDFSGSQVRIISCKILNAGDKGISGGERSSLNINNCVVSGVNIGIASKDLSVLSINQLELSDCNNGILAFQKKPEFGPGKISATNVKLNNVIQEYLIEKNSECIVNGKQIENNRNNVAKEFYVK